MSFIISDEDFMTALDLERNDADKLSSLNNKGCARADSGGDYVSPDELLEGYYGEDDR